MTPKIPNGENSIYEKAKQVEKLTFLLKYPALWKKTKHEKTNAFRLRTINPIFAAYYFSA